MNLELSNKLELHYHFTDNTHTMDAVVRNKCEHEILSIIKYISESLDVNFVVETEPYQNGGLKEIWSFTGKHGAQIAIIISIITMILSRIPLKNDNELTTLQKENLKLQNEKLELDIQLLKTTLKENKEEKLYLSEKDFNSIVAEFDESYRIIKHKSNFYKSLSSCLKIKKISTTKFWLFRVFNG